MAVYKTGEEYSAPSIYARDTPLREVQSSTTTSLQNVLIQKTDYDLPNMPDKPSLVVLSILGMPLPQVKFLYRFPTCVHNGKGSRILCNNWNHIKCKIMQLAKVNSR